MEMGGRVSQLKTPQELYLDLIRMSAYNEFDGNQVVDWLEKHSDQWSAALMVQNPPGITLRDLPKNYNNVGTLLITTRDRDDALEIVRHAKKTWRADAARVVPGPEASEMMGGSEEFLVELWWD